MLALPPIKRTVPMTSTKITASITAYSAMSCPCSSDHMRWKNWVIYSPGRPEFYRRIIALLQPQSSRILGAPALGSVGQLVSERYYANHRGRKPTAVAFLGTTVGFYSEYFRSHALHSQSPPRTPTQSKENSCHAQYFGKWLSTT